MKNRLARMPLQEYRNRDYVLSNLDNNIFEMLISGDGLSMVTAGCLDALDHIPAGSMRVVCHGYYDASVVHREIDAKQQKEIDEFMNSVL